MACADQHGISPVTGSSASLDSLRTWQQRCGSRRAGLLIGLIALIVFAIGSARLPVVDRDEARFAQASRQMLESTTWTGWVVPRVGDRLRLNKPPLIYWLQAACAWVFTGGDAATDAIWMYRVPSLIAGLVTVLITWRLGTALFDARVGVLGALIIALAPIMAWETHQARSDQVLVACTTMAMWALWHLWRGRSDRRSTRFGRWHLVLWLAVALGVMTKGPITPMVVGLTAITLALVARTPRWIVSLGLGRGLLIVALLVGPWVALVAQQVGLEHYLAIIADETLGRSASAKEGHAGPPGYHAALLIAMLWPGSMLTAVAVCWAWPRALAGRAHTGVARSRWVARLSVRPRRDAELFCLAWVLPAWLVFELVSTKLPHYTMPLYPPLALLSARAVYAASAGAIPGVRSFLPRFGVGAWLVVGGLIGIASPIGLWLVAGGRDDLVVAATAIAAAALAGVILLRTLMFTRAESFARAQYASLAVALVASVVLIGVILPRSPTPWVTTRLARALDDLDPARTRPLATVGFYEDSLTFLTRDRIEHPSDAHAEDWIDDWLAAHPRGLLVLTRRLAETRPALHRLAEVAGFDYAKGDPVDLVIVSRTIEP